MQEIQGPMQDTLRVTARDVSQQIGIVEYRLDRVAHRLWMIEQRLGAIERRIASVEDILQRVVTTADLHQELHAQTWKLIWIGVTTLAATFALACYL